MRLLVPLGFGALVVVGPFQELVATSLAAAFLGVTVFVAWTLALISLVERAFSVDLAATMIRRPGLQYLAAGILGGLPGCGGAVIVATQFVRGQVTFGALLTVLVATMGDAAFLLIARDLPVALLVIAVCTVTGIVSGWVVDRIHGRDFLRSSSPRVPTGTSCAHPPGTPLLRIAWWALVVAGLPAALLLAFQVSPEVVVPDMGIDLVALVAVGASLLSMVLWALSEPCHHAEDPAGGDGPGLEARIIGDTVLVATWVAVAFVAYGFVETHLGLDFSGMALLTSALAPALGIAVGLIPGCGPQILFTTLYLAGSVPLSAQLGNAISNDGDALFPAMAVARRAAIRATVYSAVPALLVGYGWFFLFDA